MDTGIIGCRTTSWWLCRLTLLQQRILDELSSSLYGLLKIFRDETLLHFGKSENIMDYWGSMSCIEEASMITSMAYLEAAILEYKFGRVDNSRLVLYYIVYFIFAHCAKLALNPSFLFGYIYTYIGYCELFPWLISSSKAT